MLPATSITKPQIQKIHVLLTELGMMEEKADLIFNFTNCKKSSVKELSKNEAAILIKLLADRSPKDKQKKAVVHLAYLAGIIYGESEADHKINKAKLDLFLIQRGTVKKALDEMTTEELRQTHRQFEAIVNNTRRATNYKEAKRLTSDLLKELNLTVK